MKKTCLFSFYEYIFRVWLQNNRELPEYNQIFPELPETGQMPTITLALDGRRKEIWSKTRELLLKSETEQKGQLKILQEQTDSCGLCMKCICCEKEYWKEVEKELFFNSGDKLEEKSPFLLPEKIKQLLEQKEKPVEIYLDKHRRRHFLDHNCLLMLKAFSSSMPILLNYADGDGRYSGGGFFIRWNGKGIAVDPGYRFVENLHDAGYTVLDVDIVIITHEHIDHSNDIRLLDDLHFNASVSNKDHEYNWDPNRFSISRDEIPFHKISWYMDAVTCEEVLVFSKKKSGFSPLCNNLYCINVNADETERLKKNFAGYIDVITEPAIRIEKDIVLKIFPTRHEQIESGGRREFLHHTFGCVIECSSKDLESRYIGYTSDTSVKEKDVYGDMKSAFQKCQIIIANISGIYEDDLLLQNAKARHLGYYGCYKIVKDLLKTEKAGLKYYLLSEFSNQVSDIRYDISRYLQEELEKIADSVSCSGPLVLPAEIGLTINLDTFGIKCSSCKNYSDNIHVIRPIGENQRLSYICQDCMYSGERKVKEYDKR